MTDLIETLREEALYGNTHSGQILELIEGLQGQIRVIQSASKHAIKAYEQQIAVLRQKLDEKPPVWHDDIQSLQERDAIMTDRIEKLESENNDIGVHLDGAMARIKTLKEALRHCVNAIRQYEMGDDRPRGPAGDVRPWLLGAMDNARKILEEKND